MAESMKVQLARIEETQKHLKEAVARVEDAIVPVARRVESHHIELAVMKQSRSRDRKFGLMLVTALTALGHAIANFWKQQS